MGKIVFSTAIADTDTCTINYEYDGIPIPYSDVYSDRYGIDNVIPKNGDIICFFGEFSEGAISGTQRASAIVGQAKEPYSLSPDGKAISLGLAPNATIVAIRGTLFDAWYFGVDGYDGLPGTGDEAQIVSSDVSITVYESGWDFYSKFIDWVTYVHGDGSTSFVAGSGALGEGDGFGFGTVNSPGASPAVITAGVGIDYYYRKNLDSPGGAVYDGGSNPAYGDIYPSSSKGPNMAGDPKPEIISAGAFGPCTLPVNQAWDLDIVVGPGLASATASGVLALIHDAYYTANNHYPDVDTGRRILMSGANDMGHDVLSQGGGWCNAAKSTEIASNIGGISVDPSIWVPGDFEGTSYDYFVNAIAFIITLYQGKH